MATANRAQIRRRAVGLARADGRARGYASRDGVTALFATTGTTTSITDTAGMPPPGAATTWGKDWWFYLPEVTEPGDRKRLIDSYDAAARAVTHAGPAYQAATADELVTATTSYLILKDDPDLWDSAINEALRQLLSTIMYDEFVPLVDSTIRYTTTAVPIAISGLVRASQVLDVETQVVGSGVTDAWRPWGNGYNTWRAYMDEDAVVLDFIDRAPVATDNLRIKWASQYEELTDEVTSRAVDEYWAALATLVVMSDWLADSNNPDDDWNMIGRRVRSQYMAQRRLILGTDGFRTVGRTAQQLGMVGIGGRAGRGR